MTLMEGLGSANQPKSISINDAGELVVSADISQKYLGRLTHNITTIPSGGIDLRNLYPGRLPLLLSGTLTSGSGQLHINLYDDLDDGSVKIIKNFGPNGGVQGVLGRIFDTTNNAILPIQVFYG